MWFMDWIIERLSDASGFFYELYLEVYDWVYPFWLAAGWFYNLSSLFADLSWDFYDFNLWVDDTATKVTQILSWGTIQSYIQSWFYSLGDLTAIFGYFWSNVTDVITNWWNSTQGIVQGWIADAKALLQTQIDNLWSSLNTLQSQVSTLISQIPSINEMLSWFTNWQGNLLATIVTWGALTSTQIQSLIDTAFAVREDFWSGWQDWGSKVTEFFSDPEDWLYKAVDRIVERFW